jgi:hypothetical protein
MESEVTWSNYTTVFADEPTSQSPCPLRIKCGIDREQSLIFAVRSR